MRPRIILVLAAAGALGWIGYTKLYKPDRERDKKARQLEEAFLQAVLQGDCPRAERLLEAGVDINAKDRHGRNAFEIAASQGWTSVTEMLKSHVAKVRPVSQTHRRVHVRRST